MKEAPERVPNRNGLRYSASDKLKAVKLYLEEGSQVKAIAQDLGIAGVNPDSFTLRELVKLADAGGGDLNGADYLSNAS